MSINYTKYTFCQALDHLRDANCDYVCQDNISRRIFFKYDHLVDENDCAEFTLTVRPNCKEWTCRKLNSKDILESLAQRWTSLGGSALMCEARAACASDLLKILPRLVFLEQEED